MKKQIIQTNFTAGELSPILYGHVNLDKYANGVKEATNVAIKPHGAVRRRNGTKYISEVKTSANKTRLIGIEFSTSNSFILEFGNQYIRFYKNKAQLTSGGSPYEITTPYLTADLFDITFVPFGSVVYFAHPSYAPRILTYTSDTSWTLEEIDFYPPPTLELGHTLNTTVSLSAASGLGITATAGSAVFLDADIGRQLVSKVGTGRGAITAIGGGGTTATIDIVETFSTTSYTANQTKLDLSPLADITPSGSKIGSRITLTCETPGTSSTVAAFRTTDVGRWILVHGGVVYITEYVSSSQVRGVIAKQLNALTETQLWSMEEDAWSSTLGYPRCVTIHQGRLCFGSTSYQPQTFWMSASGVFDEFGQGGALDSDAITADITTKGVSTINWMSPARGQLVLGTSGGELTISAGTAGAITPSNLTQEPRSSGGSNIQQPVIINNEIVYIQKSGKKLNTFRYTYEADNYQNDELTFLSQHFYNNTYITQIAYANDPDQQIYSVLNDGTLVIGTYYREQKIIAWSQYETSGTYESVTSINTGGNSEVWVVVKRTINGSTKRYIEVFDEGSGSDRLDGFSDCYLTYSNPKTITGITKANPAVVTSNSHGFSNGDRIKIIDVVGMTEVNGHTYLVANVAANTFELTDVNGNNINSTSYTTYSSGGEAHKLITTVSGLSHLEGKEVQIKADGGNHANKTVSGGSITLDSYYYEVTVGLAYESVIELLPKEDNAGTGTTQGQVGRWVRPIIRVVDSCIPSINDKFLPARAASDRMDSALDLFNGDLDYSSYTWTEGTNLRITTSRPLPLILVAVFGAVDWGQR
jgi:hypothetical protein